MSWYVVIWANFAPSGGWKITAIGGFLSLSGILIIWCPYVCTGWGNFFIKIFNLWPRWSNFSPVVATKYPLLVVSSRYLVYRSRNPLHTRCIQLLCKFSDFWARWPNVDLLVVNKWLQLMVFAIIWNIAHWTHFKLVKWVFRNDLIFGHLGPI